MAKLKRFTIDGQHIRIPAAVVEAAANPAGLILKAKDGTELAVGVLSKPTKKKVVAKK